MWQMGRRSCNRPLITGMPDKRDRTHGNAALTPVRDHGFHVMYCSTSDRTTITITAAATTASGTTLHSWKEGAKCVPGEQFSRTSSDRRTQTSGLMDQQRILEEMRGWHSLCPAPHVPLTNGMACMREERVLSLVPLHHRLLVSLHTPDPLHPELSVLLLLVTVRFSSSEWEKERVLVMRMNNRQKQGIT